MHCVTKLAQITKSDFYEYEYFHVSLTRIQKMRINARQHLAQMEHLDPENPTIEVQVCPELQTLVAGGVEIFGKFYRIKTFGEKKL